MWVTKLLIFPVEIRIFCPKTTKFGPKLAFLVNLGQAMQAYSMPCCGSVGGCGARAVSRKTPIYFININKMYNVWGWKGGDPEVVVRGGKGKLSQRQIGPFSKWSSSLSSPTFHTLSWYPQFRSTAFSGTLRNIHRFKIDKPMT